MQNFDLNAAAVGRASGDDASSVLGALMETPGIGLVHEYTQSQKPAPATAPAAPGMGGSKSAARPTGQKQNTEAPSAPNVDPVVPEYEVFRNDNNAVAFFMNRQPAADLSDDNGPFWFMIQDEKNIVAGSEAGQVFLADVAEDVIKDAQERGVILLIEFENHEPLRCTPCYIMA